jgi:hypothetical protein
MKENTRREIFESILEAAAITSAVVVPLILRCPPHATDSFPSRLFPFVNAQIRQACLLHGDLEPSGEAGKRSLCLPYMIHCGVVISIKRF